MSKVVTLAALAALYLAGIGGAAQFAKFSVPFIQVSLAYPNAGFWLGLIVSLISLLGVFLGFVAGVVVSRFGYRKMLLISVGVGAVLSFVEAFLPPISAMLALRVIEGGSHLGIVVAAPTLMAQLASDRWRSTVMSIWSTFFGVAFALTAWLGLPLAEQAGLPVILLGHGVFMTLVFVCLALVLKPLPTGARLEQPLNLRAILRAQRGAFTSPWASAPALGWLCYTLTYVAVLTVLPATLPPEDTLLASTLMPLAGLIVSLTLGIVLLRFIPAVNVVILGFAVGTACALVLMFSELNFWVLITMLAGLGLVQSGSFAAVPQLNATAAQQAEANGVMAQMGNLGNLVGTPILLSLAYFGGNVAIYLGIAAAYVAGIFIHIALMRRRRAA